MEINDTRILKLSHSEIEIIKTALQIAADTFEAGAESAEAAKDISFAVMARVNVREITTLKEKVSEQLTTQDIEAVKRRFQE